MLVATTDAVKLAAQRFPCEGFGPEDSEQSSELGEIQQEHYCL